MLFVDVSRELPILVGQAPWAITDIGRKPSPGFVDQVARA